VPEPDAVARNIRRFNDLGLEVHITEMDYRLKLPADPAARKAQARFFGDIVKVCLEARDCPVFAVWGVSDGYSWVHDRFTDEGEPLLFDDQCQPKAPYRAVQEALAQG
jgi:endo-1,4-beta-xylanase